MVKSIVYIKKIYAHSFWIFVLAEIASSTYKFEAFIPLLAKWRRKFPWLWNLIVILQCVKKEYSILLNLSSRAIASLKNGQLSSKHCNNFLKFRAILSHSLSLSLLLLLHPWAKFVLLSWMMTFHLRYRSKPSLAALVGCMMPFMLGICFLCPSMDCLWHKYHYCPSCKEKVFSPFIWLFPVLCSLMFWLKSLTVYVLWFLFYV